MTASEWDKYQKNFGGKIVWSDFMRLLADLAACEKERDTIARNMQVEIDKLFYRAEKAEARVKVLEDALEQAALHTGPACPCCGADDEEECSPECLYDAALGKEE